MFFWYGLAAHLVYALALLPGLVQLCRGRSLWKDRLGFSLPPHSVDLWLHAASAGEVQFLSPLVQYLRQQLPGIKMHLSVMTAAGQNAARRSFFGQLSHACLPFDLPFQMSRLLERLKPRLIVITEGEHWPYLLKTARTRRIPVILANGRISKGSFQRFKAFPKLSRQILGHYQCLFCKSESDRERYLALGVEPQRALLAGDLKFDAPLQACSPRQIASIRRKLKLQKKDFLFVAGSTRPPSEERIIIELFKRLKKKEDRLVLALAPRHLKRLPIVKRLLEQSGLEFSLYSAGGAKKPCILVDQMGVLNELFLTADLAFIGGTMSNTGGHNILEPVWAGTPVLFGPDTRNIPDLAEYIIKNNYGAQASNSKELFDLAEKFISGQKKFNRKSQVDGGVTASQEIGDHIVGLLAKYRIDK